MYNYRRSLYVKYERGQEEQKNGDMGGGGAMEEMERRKDRIEIKGRKGRKKKR
jgi:hypothetical protein